MVPVDQYPAMEVQKRQSPPRFRRNRDFTGAGVREACIAGGYIATRQAGGKSVRFKRMK
jgi:hypothetical protein